MLHRRAPLMLALGASAAIALSAHAADVALPADNAWKAFTVDSLLAPASPPTLNLGWIGEAGNPLRFSFVIGSGFLGTLTVLDTGYPGDRFRVTNFGGLLGLTSPVPVQSFDPAAVAVEDFAGALADPHFSRATFAFGAGSYSIGGSLEQSLLLDGVPLNATSGGVRLSIAPVPEPSSFALLLTGFAAVGAFVRRRRSASAC